MTMLDSILTILVALITALLGPLAVEFVKAKFLTKKGDALGKAICTDEKIDKQLELLIEELECDRICISQFHNGGNFYPTSKSIKKFSIFYERTTEYAHSIKETFQNIPVSLFPKVFSTLYNAGEIDVPDTKNNQTDCGLFPVIGKEYKTKSFYMIAIKDLNDDFVGALTISYYKQPRELQLNEWILLRSKVGAIGSILTDYLHDKS